MTRVDVDPLVETVVARIVKRTGEDPDVVASVVRRESERLAHARITAYLPVLVEHAALRRLRELDLEREVEDDYECAPPRAEAAMAAWRSDSWMA